MKAWTIPFAAMLITPVLLSVHAQPDRPGCVPVSERNGQELGCYIIVGDNVGRLQAGEAFWQLYRFPSRAAAETAKVPGATIFESLGSVWLGHIGAAGWETRGGERVAEAGPMSVREAEYEAVYMEAVFTPGMRAKVHVHSGPEAWVTLAGETCLETPDKIYVGRAGEPPVIVPEGPPMALTAIGTEIRKAVVLILHDASKPHTTLTHDWTPKGRCDQYLRK
jgi:quercetin dioxygenase-like cupin family protein